MVTFADLIQIGILISSIVNLFLQVIVIMTQKNNRPEPK